MRNNRLWQRVVATALAVVLALPVAGIGSVKQAEAKTTYKAVIEEDFSGDSYCEKIMAYNGGQLDVKDGVMYVSGPAGSGIRAAFVDVEPEQTYRISYKAKVDKSSVNAFIQPWRTENGEEVEGSYGDADYLGYACYQWGDGNWHDFCVEYTVPADKNQIQFVLYENDGNANYAFAIDDLMIEAVKEIPNLVVNGNFGEENAETKGWDVETASKQQVVTKTEYIVNGDFEGEAINYAEGNSANASIVSGQGVDGSRALKFTRASETTTPNPYVFFTPTGLDTTGTVEYTLSFKLRSTGAHWQGYIINQGADNWGAIGWTAASDTWTEYTYKFVTTTGTAQIGIQAVQGAGDIYIDDFSVSVEEAQTEQIKTEKFPNGDFEGEAINYAEGNSANASIVSGEGVDGSRALKFTRASETTTPNPYVFFTPTGLDTTGTVEYTLSFKLRSTGAHWQGYIINQGADNWGAIGWTAANDTWTEYTYKFVTTTGTAQIGIQAVQGAGDIYIDDFSVAVIKETPVYIYTDGVGEFGRDGYGLKITDDTATATVGATENIYEYSVWVKLEQGAHVALLANGAQEVATSDKSDGEWINLSGVFVAEDGLETFGIEAEGTVYVDDVEVYAHVHDLVLVKGKAANCTESGVKEHYVCSLCDLHFQDEAGTIALTEEDYVIPAKGHQYRKVTTKASYKKAGKIVEICDCGKVKSTTVIYAPTSITASSKKYNKKSQTTTIVVKDSKGKVIPSSEYTVSGNKATKVGTYTATVTFKGSKYTGKMSVKWKIYPLGTSIKSVKSLRKSLRITWSSQKSETSGYKIQVSTDKHFKKSVKTVKISKNKSTYTTVKGLKAYKKYYIRICTYKGSYVSSWSKVKTAKTR